MLQWIKAPAFKHGLLAGLLSVLTLFCCYLYEPRLAMHPVIMQSVLIWYILSMIMAMRSQLANQEKTERMVLLRTAFATFLVANLVFYGAYALATKLEPSLLEYLRTWYEEMTLPSVAPEDLPTARKELAEADFGGFKAVAFNYARGSIGGFVLAFILSYFVYRLHPGSSQ
jgi:hypothetical protein